MKKKPYKVNIETVMDPDSGLGGIGVVIRDWRGHVLKEISDSVEGKDENKALYRALTLALQEMRERNIRHFRVRSTSEFFVRQMQGIYRMKNPIMKQLKNMIRTRFHDVDIEFVRVPMNENTKARDLAERGLEKEIQRESIRAIPLSMVSRREAFAEGEVKPDTDIQRSAGGILYKKDGDKYKICIIAKRDFKVWALPKGRVAPGETPEETAVREVSEETGHLGEIQTKVDEIDYFFYWKDNNTLYHKFVYFYLMKLVQENAREPDEEADAIRWITPGEAHRKLTYINEKEIINKAWNILEQI